MTSVTIVFPHQLFEINPAVTPGLIVYLVEESLFFSQYNFHKQKLIFHRASMKYYESFLIENGFDVVYVEANDCLADIRWLIPHLIGTGVTEIHYCDVADNWLERRIRKAAAETALAEHATPLFINSRDDLSEYFHGRKHYFQTDFYTKQRKRLKILVDEDLRPTGGKWSFDAENRLKYPKAKVPPAITFPVENEFGNEAAKYVEDRFRDNYGELNSDFRLPVTHGESTEWLAQFLELRFREFAITKTRSCRGKGYFTTAFSRR